MKIRCPGCRAGLEVDRSQAGDHVPCPRCGRDLDLSEFERAAARMASGAGTDGESPKPPSARGPSWVLPAVLGVVGLVVSGAGLLFYFGTGSTGTTVAAPVQPAPSGQVTAPSTVPHPEPDDRDGQPVDEPLPPTTNTTVPTTPAQGPEPETADKPSAPRKAAYWEIDTRVSEARIDGRTIRIRPSTDRQSPRNIRFYLPRGTHLVQVGDDIDWLEIENDLFDRYVPLYQAITDSDLDRAGQTVKAQTEILARTFMAGTEGLPYHLLGNFYYAESRRKPERKAAFLEAARVKYIQAIRTDPGLAPAHLNLACILKELGELDLAKREVLVALLLNTDNVFGLQGGSEALMAELGIKPPESVLDIPWSAYSEETATAPLDRRMVKYHEAILRYAAQASERAKLWSNLGLYFAGQAGKPRLAERYYHRALRTLGDERDVDNRQHVLKVVSNNLLLLASKYRMPERFEYEQLARICGN